MGHCKSSAKGKVHSNIGFPQETSQINNLTLHLKQLEKEEMKNPWVSRRKEILKIMAEINAKETKEIIAKITTNPKEKEISKCFSVIANEKSDDKGQSEFL